MTEMFSNFKELKELKLKDFDTRQLASMEGIFSDCI